MIAANGITLPKKPPTFPTLANNKKKYVKFIEKPLNRYENVKIQKFEQII